MNRKKKSQQVGKNISKEKLEKQSELKTQVFSGMIILILSLLINRMCNSYDSSTAKNEELDQKIDNLYTAITFKHDKPKEDLENLNSSRMHKLKVIQEIQKNIHSKAFKSLEKIVPTIKDNSSVADWDKTINAHIQLERQLHKDFSIAEAKAFWDRSLTIAQKADVSPMAKTELFSEKPALELAASSSNVGINLENLEQKNVQGVVLKVKELKYIPSNYPIIPSSDGKSIFIPNVDSLDSLHYFESIKGKADDMSELEKGMTP